MDQALHPDAPGYLRVFRGTDGDVYFSVMGWNHEPTSTSEGHKNRGDVADLLERYYPEWPIDNELIEGRG